MCLHKCQQELSHSTKGPRWQSGNTLASHLCGWGSIPVMAVCGKAGSCLPLVGSLQYRTLGNSMYWFPLPFQLPVVIWPVQCWKRRKTPNKHINTQHKPPPGYVIISKWERSRCFHCIQTVIQITLNNLNLGSKLEQLKPIFPLKPIFVMNSSNYCSIWVLLLREVWGACWCIG